MLPTLSIKLLGDFCLIAGDVVVPGVAAERLQALLGYLLLHRDTPQPRQRVAFHLWPDSNDELARTNLRRTLHQLRRSLPHADQFLSIESRTLQWQPNACFTLDVAEFEQAIADAKQAEQIADAVTVQTALKKAVSLYKGHLLPSCDDEWILSEREQLQQQYVRALEWLIGLLEDQQDYRVAIHYAQQLLRIEPLHEVAYASLMRLHVAAGDRANALRVYHRCMTALREELGVDPSPSTRATYESILMLDEVPSTKSEAGEATKEAQPASQGPSQAVETITSAVLTSTFPVSTPAPLLPLIGREWEWSAIAEWLESAAPSRVTELLLLVGESGIGKTRLLEEIAQEVRSAQGCLLWGRGFEAEMVRPYGAWIDALRGIAACGLEHFPRELEDLLTNNNPAAVALESRSRLFDAVAQLLARLSATAAPTLVILDDIQWLDEASTALLHYVARSLSNTAILFACAARQHELQDNPPVLKLIQAFRREQRVRTLELSPLNPEQTAALAQLVNDKIDRDRIFADSGGNPLFTLEVARALQRSELSSAETLEALIHSRLLQLDDASRELIPWAAALGRSFSPTLLARIADYPLLKLLAAMEQLERRGLIRPGLLIDGEVGYDFAHDIVRQVAYHQLSGPRRRLVHLHIAHALNELLASNAALVSDIAHHASLGGDHELAASASLATAERCLRLFAYTEASDVAQRGIFHCRALSDRSRIRMHLKLLKTYVLTGITKEQAPQIEAELQRLIEEAAGFGLKDEEMCGLEALIMLNYDHDNLSNVHQHSLRAAETSRAASPTTVARMLAQTGSCLAEIGRDIQRAEALLLEAQALKARVDLEIIDIPFGLGCVRRYIGDYDGAQDLLKQGWRMAKIAEDHWRECTCLTNLVMVALETEHPDQALPYCQELATVAAQMGGEGSEQTAAIALDSLARYQLGQGEAAETLERSLTALRELDAPRILAYVLTGAAEFDLNQQRIQLALTRAQEGLTAAQRVNDPSAIALAGSLLMQAEIALKREKLAIARFQELQSLIDQRTVNHRAQIAWESISQQLQSLVQA